jgi:sigma-B regulation protein RsbU (phosphoserine phosphatase)
MVGLAMESVNKAWWRSQMVTYHLIILGIVEIAAMLQAIFSYRVLSSQIGHPFSWGLVSAFVLISSTFIGFGFIFYVRWLKRLIERIGLLYEQMSSIHMCENFVCPLPLKGKLYLSSANEIEHIQRGLALAQELLRRRLDKIEAVNQNKEEIAHELQIACDIQLSVVPKKFPAFPERKEFDLYAFLQPAKEMGGDLYNFFLLDEDHLAFVIGDVSDKGLPSALLMAVTNTYIRAKSKVGVSPAEVMRVVNCELSRHNPSCMFVTAFMGILEISTGQVEFSLAGHNPPYILRGGGKVEVIDVVSSIALGATEEATYENHTIYLNAGDLLFMFTDGVTEAMDERNNLYGEPRLEGRLDKFSGASASSLIFSIYQDIKEHAASAPQSDDITMLALRYFGA